MLLGTELGIFRPLPRNCSFYFSWCDQLASAPAKRPSQVRSTFRSPGVGLLVGFQAAIVRVLSQGIHDPRRPCPGENMRFFNPLAVAFAVDTVISVNRIFLSARAPAPQLEIPNVRRALPLL